MARGSIKTPRDFPAVETLLQSTELNRAAGDLPRPVVARLTKEVVAELKRQLKKDGTPLSRGDLFARLSDRLLTEQRRRITRVINGTGIVVHTNLGRAPLSESIFEQIKQTVTGYGNIEFSLADGKRGGRGAACESYLAELSGAEAGTVVNNGAAALFLILNSLANRKRVLISRGELVQIGGGFRIPDILRRSGAKLAEVGTTNITSLSDYENAIDDRTGLILKVHKSNFVQAGFTDEVDLKPLVALGQKHGLPVINDLGSGVFTDTRDILGYHEPTVQESVRAGADLTCFSGDKMLGGMQSGLIVGTAELVTKIKKNPIFRTVRVDKVVFSILEKLLAAYLSGNHDTTIKLWQVLNRSTRDLEKMARRLLSELGNPAGVKIEKTSAFVGGGAMPEHALESVGLVFVDERSPGRIMTALRKNDPPVIGRIEQDRFILDLKAIDEADLPDLVCALKSVLERSPR